MSKPKKLALPERGEVKIWFQGVTCSGKSLLQKVVIEALESRGIEVRRYDWRLDGQVDMKNQVVDLTNQNIDDVLTVEIKIWRDLGKLQSSSKQRLTAASG